MFLSKIWFILITLVAGVAVTMALVAPRPAVQKLEQLEGQRLDRAQYAADQMLKTDAHRWIDRASSVGRDAQISEALDSASRGAGELGVLRKTVQQRLRALITDHSKVAQITAVDKNGRVVARLGQDEEVYGDSIAGAEVIADALRGFMSDDVWGLGGKMMRVAAAPALSRNHDRIVGAIVFGAETDLGLADKWKKNLGVDIAILLHNKVVASTEQAAKLGNLGELIEQHAKEITEAGRTSPIPIQTGSERLLVVAAPFVGQASMQGAFYALIGKRPAQADLKSLILNVTSDDLKWGQFPWISIGGGLLGVLLIGLFLQMWEVERPLRELRREVKQLAHGAIAKLQDTQFSGRFGGLARDFNAALERYTLAPERPSEMAGKDINAILGADTAAGSSFDVADSSSSFGNDPLPAFAPPPPSMFAPPPPPAFAPPPPPGFAPPPAPGFTPPPAVPRPGSHAPAAPAPAQPFAPNANEGPTPVQAVAAEDEETAHARQVFDEFLAIKKRCGEPTAGLTFDKFRQKLADNKAQLMSRYECKTVRFSVYVKDGKATLKATPIKS